MDLQGWGSDTGRLTLIMLSHLSIRDIVLIERLDMDFSGGLSVLTGETGAGKSILLDSLSLALGGRGDASLVRHGADQGR
ncbi:DNA repair protein RecN [Nitratireductor aquibiodomus RA22]|uniref:DNA repair protein RecN n=1 Tax=Nitratireductor aquibiodomus RA22 TaxID=1189611 RepID=I5C2Y7_9HYPH|nr:DNA repair protein RecN [Nitratireductor aquibiodomus RA22]